ncbi:MAG: hypothetical protein AAF658_00015 [Myxococcota bacterium]
MTDRITPSLAPKADLPTGEKEREPAELSTGPVDTARFDAFEATRAPTSFGFAYDESPATLVEPFDLAPQRGTAERRFDYRRIPFTTAQTLADLKRLAGDELTRALANGDDYKAGHIIATPAGEAEALVQYRTQYHDIFVTLTDTQQEGTSLRIELDESNRPTHVSEIDDPDHVISGLMYIWGIDGLTPALGEPSPHRLHARLGALAEYRTIQEELRLRSADPALRIAVDKSYTGPADGVFVDQDEYSIAARSTPLSTAGLDTCSAFIVTGPDAHLLAHVDSSSSPDEIAALITNNFDNPSQLSFAVMEGPTPSGTLQAVYTALRRLGVEDNMRFASYEGRGVSYAVAVRDGELYLPTGPEFAEHSTQSIGSRPTL